MLVTMMMLLSQLVTMVMLMSPEGEYVEVFDKCGIGGGLKTACDANDRISKVDFWNRIFKIQKHSLLIVFNGDKEYLPVSAFMLVLVENTDSFIL